MLKENFECFNVYKKDDASAFVYVNFTNIAVFIDGLLQYIFDENNLLNYISKTKNIKFDATKRNYIQLFKNISIFLNPELESLSYDKVNDQLLTVLKEEFSLVDINGKLLIQNDKIGKIGEYIFHLFLTHYYQLDCILPKFKFTTDRNMSVFGIDALFLNSVEREIFFGESKVSKSMKNAVVLLKSSLKNYEEQIKEEYRIILSSEDSFPLSIEFKDLFEEYTQLCITFEEFIRKGHITKIGVPIFVAYGESELTEEDIEKDLDYIIEKIEKRDFCSLPTEYYFICLPILDKNLFCEAAIKKVVEKQHEYEQSAKCV